MCIAQYRVIEIILTENCEFYGWKTEHEKSGKEAEGYFDGSTIHDLGHGTYIYIRILRSKNVSRGPKLRIKRFSGAFMARLL